jgi:hypothetical protein
MTKDRVLVLRPANADRDHLRLRGLQLRLRGYDLGSRRDAGCVLVARDLQSSLIRRHGVAQQALERIDTKCRVPGADDECRPTSE